MTIGLEKADAAAAMSMSYSSIVWAELAGVLAFHEYPNAWSLLGIVIIIGGTVYCGRAGKQQSQPRVPGHEANGYESVRSYSRSPQQLGGADLGEGTDATAGLRASVRLSKNGSAAV